MANVTYSAKRMSIEKLPVNGVRIDRVHGKEYRVIPRLYSVSDLNLNTKGKWVAELHEKRIERDDGTYQKATVVKVALAPRRATNRLAALTRQSIMIQTATRGRYRGRPYAHITFREPQQFGGKKTAGRGEKSALPAWFVEKYGRKTRLRATVQGKVRSDHAAGKRLAKYHDIKQVVVFDKWDDKEFIRLLFIMRVYSAEQGFQFSADSDA